LLGNALLIGAKGLVEKLLVCFQEVGGLAEVLTAERAIRLYQVNALSNELFCFSPVLEIPVNVGKNFFLGRFVGGSQFLRRKCFSAG